MAHRLPSRGGADSTQVLSGSRRVLSVGYPAGMARPLSRKIALAELHCHLGGAVTPSIMWGIAHSQGIKLPTKDYWEFRDMITVSPRRNRSFDGYLQLFHWTELIQSSPLAVERSVYEVVGGAYRKNNVTTMELRFNPMKRNRGGEQDLDHIIAAAVRGHGQGVARVPGQARAHLLPGSRVPVRAQRDHRGEGHLVARPRRGRHRYRRPGVGDVPGRGVPPTVPPRAAVRPRASRSIPASPAPSRRSPGSSSCSNQTASVMG